MRKCDCGHCSDQIDFGLHVTLSVAPNEVFVFRDIEHAQDWIIDRLEEMGK